jgi:hypothetical protein
LAAVAILTAACAPKSPQPTPQVVPTIPGTLPVSGYERPRGEWSGDKLRVSATCYAYALDLTKDPRDGTDWVRDYSLQPGEISGNQITYGADWKTIIDAATSDLKKLGRTLTYSSSDEACPSGSYKIALAIDPLNNDNFNELYDFHFYRQDQDGGWSSKHGHAFVEDWENGKRILDPSTIERINPFNKKYKYSEFDGFFCISTP